VKDYLREYVARADGAFAWRIIRALSLHPDLSAYELRLTSQLWRGIAWRHRLLVLIPRRLRDPSLALLLLTGGNHLYLGQVARVATATGAPCAILYNVPRQPLFGGLREDALMSYTFRHFIETGDRDWPLLFPMVKSAVRAMDALQAFATAHLGRDLDGFLVTGGSKRGWTTWLTPVVDPRVRGIAPAVYDNLHIPRQMRHQIAVWGEFSERIHDYTEKGLPQMAASGRADMLVPAIDPYAHLERITVPKLLIIGTNDRYWPLDACNLYLDELQGDTRLLYVPNTGHDALRTTRARNALSAFLLTLSDRVSLPELDWCACECEGGLQFRVPCSPCLSALTLWSAEAPRRDFREALWKPTPLSVGDGSAQVRVATSKPAYTACFLEGTFRTGDMSFCLSTPVHILGPSGAVISRPEKRCPT